MQDTTMGYDDRLSANNFVPFTTDAAMDLTIIGVNSLPNYRLYNIALILIKNS